MTTPPQSGTAPLERPRLFFGCFLLLLLPLTLYLLTFVVSGMVYFEATRLVHPGNVGVVFGFNGVDPAPLEPGQHVLAPWHSVTQISVEPQFIDDPVTVRTRSKQPLDLTCHAQVSLKPGAAPALCRTVGPQYLEKVVKPAVRSAAIDVARTYDAVDFGTERIAEIERRVADVLSAELENHGIRCEQVVLTFPPTR